MAFLVACYRQGKSTKNTVNRVRLRSLRTLSSRSFCRQIENIHRVLDRFKFSFPLPSKHLHVGYVQFGKNRRKIPSLCAASIGGGGGGWGVWCFFNIL